MPLRLFNSKSDTIDVSKMQTRDGRKVHAAVVMNTGRISVMLLDGGTYHASGIGKAVYEELDLFIEAPHPVITKEYANDYGQDGCGIWVQSLKVLPNFKAAVAIIERTIVDGKPTSYRLVEEGEK